MYIVGKRQAYLSFLVSKFPWLPIEMEDGCDLSADGNR